MRARTQSTTKRMQDKTMAGILIFLAAAFIPAGASNSQALFAAVRADSTTALAQALGTYVLMAFLYTRP